MPKNFFKYQNNVAVRSAHSFYDVNQNPKIQTTKRNVEKARSTNRDLSTPEKIRKATGEERKKVFARVREKLKKRFKIKRKTKKCIMIKHRGHRLIYLAGIHNALTVSSSLSMASLENFSVAINIRSAIIKKAIIQEWNCPGSR